MAGYEVDGQSNVYVGREAGNEERQGQMEHLIQDLGAFAP